MYRCGECGATFDVPKVDMIKIPLYKKTLYERAETCPKCGSIDVFIAARCRACGEWRTTEFEDYCKECSETADKLLRKAINKVCTSCGTTHDVAIDLLRGRWKYHDPYDD